MMKSYGRKTAVATLFFIMVFLIVNAILLSSPTLGQSLQDTAYLDGLLLFTALVFWFGGFFAYVRRIQPVKRLTAKKPETGESAFSLAESVIPRNAGDWSYTAEIIDYLYEYHKSCIGAYRKDIDELNDYITQWVHEIKIPISVLELLLEKDETGGETHTKMKVELERTRFLVNQILYASRATHYNQDLRITEFNLEKTVKDSVKRNAVPFIMKNIEITLRNLDYNLTNDEKWLSYILDQILNNASKYTGENGRVDIWAGEDDRDITLCIQDNGAGIAPGELGRIFEKGFTGENGHKTAKSTGMGLYYSKRMAERLDIGLNVFSEPQVYTRFELLFKKAYTW